MSGPSSPTSHAASGTDTAAWAADAAPVPTGHWDELRSQVQAGPQSPDKAALSGPWQRFFGHLGEQPEQALNAAAAQVARQVRDNGISYNLYADTREPQRPWSLDLFPLLVGPESWQQIEAGVRQRMALLEHTMADAYGPLDLVKQGLLPAALVQGHPGYLHAMHGAQPVGGQFLNLAAFDLVRGPDGHWWLLSQRTQAPSGLGYLLENRILISRQFPDAFEALGVHRLAASYRNLVSGLKARCPQGQDAHIVLLTPGPYNETYFEHAYLARYLGLTLVQGSDLTVRAEQVYLKTLQGLQPVHGMLKRVDDAWLDPLELRPESSLGVPGLLQAIRSGKLLVANTPGSGFLESSALLGFMPGLCQHLTGEALSLPAIPSWWCGEQAARLDALPRLPSCVIKPSYPSGSGQHSFEPVLGHRLGPGEQADWQQAIGGAPEAHTLQAYLPLSHTPTWHSGSASLANKPVILRVFAFADAAGQWQVLPGGLARLGTQDGIASMQRGGSSADAWVLAPASDAPAPQGLLPSPMRPQQAVQRQRVVSSRSAENLFWMGRYTERSENCLRLASLVLQNPYAEDAHSPAAWAWLTQLAQHQGMVLPNVPTGLAAKRVFERSLVNGLWDTEQNTSLGFNLRAIRSAASGLRERLSLEHWQLIEQAEQGFFAAAQAPQGTQPSTEQARRSLVACSQLLAAITGAQTDRMGRDDGWRLLSIGRHIERLGFLAQALEQALRGDLLEGQAGYDAVLALFDSTMPFHEQYQQSRTPAALLSLLLIDQDNPRALGWVAQTLRGRLARMGSLANGATHGLAQQVPPLWDEQLARWCPDGNRIDPEALPPLLDLLGRCQDSASAICESLSGLFFTHSGDAAHTVGV